MTRKHYLLSLLLCNCSRSFIYPIPYTPKAAREILPNTTTPRLALPQSDQDTLTSTPRASTPGAKLYHHHLMPTANRQSSTTISPLTTILLLCGFLVAFFPSLFHSIIWAPYNLAFPDHTPRAPTTVHCTEPHICVAPEAVNKMSWYVLASPFPSPYLHTPT